LHGQDGPSAASLAAALKHLQSRYGASGIKLSTEDAGMGFEQIAFWTGVAEGIVPVGVKIGGPNARNDIKQLLRWNVAGLIAPMVESPYGLENFVTAVRELCPPHRFDTIRKQINIETLTAVEQLEAILSAPEAKYLDEITLGCSDLSKSMGKRRDDPEVWARVRKAVSRIDSQGLRVSVGGGISPEGIDRFLEIVRPPKFNTRVITFDRVPGRSYREAVIQALRFELQMLQHDVAGGFLTRDEQRGRAAELQKRLPESLSFSSRPRIHRPFP
ncbi:MAG: hypothetical protein GWM98_03960, partial [Nitrospinaceae bacterium]|nr:hypothetical protein [Nitrospinaceae bacterium]NIR53814.1 hypothetical protein [Nitrospinaceae bacterium]NIS84225.1 hypothetical protein [Nitrospinaceae bacterium]NIT81031.1 hypothetical protein [Nitrospinaceae bacterium]NIU43320.1 hypothetical protein [Nitrospinaceae bacterium]